MPSTGTYQFSRKLLHIDNEMFDIITRLLEYYRALLSHEPLLAAMVEALMMEQNDMRLRLGLLYRACWKRDDAQFYNLDDLSDILAEQRKAVGIEELVWQDFGTNSGHWQRTFSELYARRGRAWQRLSLSGDLIPRQSASQKLNPSMDVSESEKDNETS